MSDHVCPICGIGSLAAKVDVNDAIEYRGISSSLPLHYSECDYCGSETATASQAHENKRLMEEFKARVDKALDGLS